MTAQKVHLAMAVAWRCTYAAALDLDAAQAGLDEMAAARVALHIAEQAHYPDEATPDGRATLRADAAALALWTLLSQP